MASGDISEDWYLAQLKPNGAKTAILNLSRQGFRTFLPLHAVTRRAKSKFVTSDQPLFPGYIFVAFEALKGGWQSINSTSGISRLVSFGRDPAPVPEGIIKALMARCDDTMRLMPPDELREGDE
ncbi:MAG: transcriptional activator RfaH, partial [Pseudomonadota bacterium]